MNLDIQAVGAALVPLFEHLPEIPLGEWHRFSFDVVQTSSGVQVAHIRFAPIVVPPSPANPSSR